VIDLMIENTMTEKNTNSIINSKAKLVTKNIC